MINFNTKNIRIWENVFRLVSLVCLLFLFIGWYLSYLSLEIIWVTILVYLLMLLVFIGIRLILSASNGAINRLLNEIESSKTSISGKMALDLELIFTNYNSIKEEIVRVNSTVQNIENKIAESSYRIISDLLVISEMASTSNNNLNAKMNSNFSELFAAMRLINELIESSHKKFSQEIVDIKTREYDNWISLKICIDKLTNETSVIRDFSVDMHNKITDENSSKEKLNRDFELVFGSLHKIDSQILYVHTALNNYINLLKSVDENIHLANSLLSGNLDNTAVIANEVKRVFSEFGNMHLEKLEQQVDKLISEYADFTYVKGEQESGLKSISENWEKFNLFFIERTNWLNNNMKWKVDEHYKRLDALFSIYNYVNHNTFFPNFVDWSISSDSAYLILKYFLESKDGIILDIGSGSSTFLFSLISKGKHSRRIISLDNDLYYYNKTKTLLQLNNTYDNIELYHVPLKTYEINQKEWIWYDISKIDFGTQKIAMIMVDGPAGNVQKNSRYPACALLEKYIRKDTVIILDDGHREDEKEVVNIWKDEFSLASKFYNTSKGLFVLSKDKSAL